MAVELRRGVIVAEIGFKLARFEGFAEGVQTLLGPHNPTAAGCR